MASKEGENTGEELYCKTCKEKTKHDYCGSWWPGLIWRSCTVCRRLVVFRAKRKEKANVLG